MALESQFQKRFIQRLKDEFPGCEVIKGNSAYRQGVPDILFLWRNNWALLEIKKDDKAPFEPNQEWYIEYYNQMSYSSVVRPNNADEVIREIQQTFGV